MYLINTVGSVYSSKLAVGFVVCSFGEITFDHPFYHPFYLFTLVVDLWYTLSLVSYSPFLDYNLVIEVNNKRFAVEYQLVVLLCL